MRYRTATQWGVYQVEVNEGQIASVHGVDEDPDPSEIGQVLVDGVHHASRIKRPAVRRGWLERRDRRSRGVDEFVDVPWDEALDLAADELARVAREHGNTSIFAGSYGWASAGRFHHAQSQLHRFVNLIGGSTRAMNSYSTAAAQVILPHVVAPWHQVEVEQNTWQEIASHADLVVAFGGVPLRNTQVAYGGITEHQSAGGLRSAAEAGVSFVSISPMADDMPDWLNCQQLAPRPGTDVALMLGIAHVLETERLCDDVFLESHCVGYRRFRDYLLGITDGAAKTAAWASQICDVPETQIADLARRMARSRTLVTAAWSLQRAQYGEQPYWMVVTLAAMLGQIGLPGVGFGFGYGAEGFVGSPWRRFNWAPVHKGRNPTRFAIPVARIADMLLNPGETIEYDGSQITLPDTQLIYWAGGNPFHHHQDLNRLVEAWRKPASVIVNEPWWTPTAQWADIVFPITTALERQDICASSHDPYAHAMQQALAPQYEARSDHEVFKGLSERLGVLDAFAEGRSEEEWLREMWRESQELAARQDLQIPDFDVFWEEGSFRIPDLEERPVWLGAFRSDPQRYPLRTPSGKIEIFSEKIESFGYADCPPHPTWLEPCERLGGQGNDKFPLHLLTPQPARRLHSQLDVSAYSQAGKIEGKEVLSIHPSAAQDRRLRDGDVVKVYNERGACLAGVRIDANMRGDVVALPTGAWYAPGPDGLELNGNPNVLTVDIGTSSLAQGPSANTCLVEVERYVADAS